MIGDFCEHIKRNLSKEISEKLHVCDQWVSAENRTALKAHRKEYLMDSSYCTSTAIRKFAESKKDYALFFLHVRMPKFPPKKPTPFHAWLLFFSKVESVAVFFNPHEEPLDHLPSVPSSMYKRLQPKGRKEVELTIYPGLQRMDEHNCIARCVKFSFAVVRRENLEWSNGSFLKELSSPYKPVLCKRKAKSKH